MKRNLKKKIISILVINVMVMGANMSALAEENTIIQDEIISEGEMLQEQSVSTEGYQVIQDEIISADDVKNYNIELDFSTMDTAAICLVRTGESYVKMEVKDKDGNIIKTIGAADYQPKRWLFIDKPSIESVIVSYTVTVTCTKYREGSSQFRIMAGNKNDVEEMISGMENATPLEWYTQKQGNFVHTEYTPNQGECWYRFTVEEPTVTFTLVCSHSELRFKVIDPDTYGVVFDSNAVGNEDVHKDKFCGGFDYGEKKKLKTLTVGKEYYLVLYTPNGISTNSFVEDTINVAVGMPRMQTETTKWIYASKSVSATKSSFSLDASISVGDNGVTIPKNAYATCVYYGGGVRPSAIAYWRVKEPSKTTWKKSSNFGTSIEINYEDDSNSNTNINGTWRVGFQASSTTQTFIPSIRINYKYEVGD